MTRTYAHFLEGLLAQALELRSPTPSTVTAASDPLTEVLTPHEGASVSGVQLIDVTATDSVAIHRVEVRLSGPGVPDVLLGYARLTLFGWLLDWNTPRVPNGTYALRSSAYDADGKVAQSTPIVVMVRN